VRGIVGHEGALRAPPVLEAGPGWLIEVRKDPQPVSGAAATEALVRAAAEVPSLDLPALEQGGGPAAVVTTAWRRIHLALSALPVRDVARARSIISGSPLPRVTSHGDFHVENVLISDDCAWVVDWELSGRRPAGYDLMQLWATLPDPSDRDRVWRGALALVGEQHAQALAELRYALVVRTIANKLSAPQRFHRDPEGARLLLDLLPGLRPASRRVAAGAGAAA
jgi:aminoglycoside phosphotransferase (APT) family kinase protein